MVREPVVALVVAEPGRLRDAWRALVAAVPGIGDTYLADDAPSALRLVEAHCPTLVLVDGELRDGGTPALVNRIKQLHPGAHCIVLTCCTGDQSAPAGVQADAVLVKGFPAARLFETVSRVLSDT